jgi:hypothetical protein
MKSFNHGPEVDPTDNEEDSSMTDYVEQLGDEFEELNDRIRSINVICLMAVLGLDEALSEGRDSKTFLAGVFNAIRCIAQVSTF